MEQKLVINEMFVDKWPKVIPEYLKKAAKMDETSFKSIFAKVCNSKNINSILDVCSGRGRTARWMLAVKPNLDILCSDIDMSCVRDVNAFYSEKSRLYPDGNNIKAIQFDINKNDWPTNQYFDVITCFGGTTQFINWNRFLNNISFSSDRHIIHFNRNDTLDALDLYHEELDRQNLTYISYSPSDVFDIYKYVIPEFKILDMTTNNFSIIVYAELK